MPSGRTTAGSPSRCGSSTSAAKPCSPAITSTWPRAPRSAPDHAPPANGPPRRASSVNQIRLGSRRAPRDLGLSRVRKHSLAAVSPRLPRQGGPGRCRELLGELAPLLACSSLRGVGLAIVACGVVSVGAASPARAFDLFGLKLFEGQQQAAAAAVISDPPPSALDCSTSGATGD